VDAYLGGGGSMRDWRVRECGYVGWYVCGCCFGEVGKMTV